MPAAIAKAHAAITQLQDEWAAADAAVRAARPDAVIDFRGVTWSVGMIYVHVIAEYARHNGHADLIREEIDGVTGR